MTAGLTKGSLTPPLLLYKMAKDKVNMPATTAGLTRYFDDYRSKIDFTPGHVIIITLIIAIAVLILHLYGGRLIGI